jgi:hypothetical protein
VLEETNIAIKGETQRVPVKGAYINVNAEPGEPFGSAVAPKPTNEQTRFV